MLLTTVAGLVRVVPCLCFQVNEVNLENVTHEDAVAALKATQERVKLVIAKPTYIHDQGDHIPHSCE